MASRLPLTDKAGEVRELTSEDFKRFKSAAEILPAELTDILPKRGRPPLEVPKKAISIRLSQDIIDAFLATGSGWQTRINNALREWLKEHHT